MIALYHTQAQPCSTKAKGKERFTRFHIQQPPRLPFPCQTSPYPARLQIRLMPSCPHPRRNEERGCTPNKRTPWHSLTGITTRELHLSLADLPSQSEPISILEKCKASTTHPWSGGFQQGHSIKATGPKMSRWKMEEAKGNDKENARHIPVQSTLTKLLRQQNRACTRWVK